MLPGGIEIGEAPAAVVRLACPVDGGKRRAVEIHEGRAHVENARLEQRFLGRNRQLVIDEMHDAGLPRGGNERLAERLQRPRLLGTQHAQRHALRARLARGEQNVGAADREGKRAERGAFHELTPFDPVHDRDPPSPGAATGRLQHVARFNESS